VDYAHVVADIALLVDGMNIESIAFDRWKIAEFQREMNRAELELPMRPCGQGYRDMSPCIEAATELMLNEKVRHGGHPVLTYAATSAVVVRDPAGNVKLDKSRVNCRIDPLVAFVMSIGEMRRTAESASASVPILVF
jgi:phage terminase large subunit-like protein